jgi:hypothetical protein
MPTLPKHSPSWRNGALTRRDWNTDARLHLIPAKWGLTPVSVLSICSSVKLKASSVHLSPRDSQRPIWFDLEGNANVMLRKDDQAVEALRQTGDIWLAEFARALALAGHEADARATVQRYLSLPGTQGRQSRRSRSKSLRYCSLLGHARALLRRPAQGGHAGGVRRQSHAPPCTSATCSWRALNWHVRLPGGVHPVGGTRN